MFAKHGAVERDRSRSSLERPGVQDDLSRFRRSVALGSKFIEVPLPLRHGTAVDRDFNLAFLTNVDSHEIFHARLERAGELGAPPCPPEKQFTLGAAQGQTRSGIRHREVDDRSASPLERNPESQGIIAERHLIEPV